jgi:hypothetical protein
MSDDGLDDLKLLIELEHEFKDRYVWLRGRRMTRLRRRIGDGTKVVYWVESEAEQDEHEAMQAIEAIHPTQWWKWAKERFDAHESPPEAL